MNISKLRQERDENITTPVVPPSMRRGMNLPKVWNLRKVILAAIILFLLPLQLRAQEGTWTLSGAVGYGVLSLGDVDSKNSRDVQGYNDQALFVEEMPSLKAAPMYFAKVTYRATRELGFSLSVLYTTKEVSTVYNGSDDYLMLKRGVSSTDVTLGMAYFPSAQLYFLEWYVQGDIGLLLGRANAETFGTHTYKVGGQPDVRPTIDTKGIYDKSKLDVAVRIGANAPLVRKFFLRAEGGYRLAVLGKLNGTVSRLSGTTSEETSIDFDYSAIFATVGVGIEF